MCTPPDTDLTSRRNMLLEVDELFTLVLDYLTTWEVYSHIRLASKRAYVLSTRYIVHNRVNKQPYIVKLRQTPHLSMQVKQDKETIETCNHSLMTYQQCRDYEQYIKQVDAVCAVIIDTSKSHNLSLNAMKLGSRDRQGGGNGLLVQVQNAIHNVPYHNSTNAIEKNEVLFYGLSLIAPPLFLSRMKQLLIKNKFISKSEVIYKAHAKGFTKLSPFALHCTNNCSTCFSVFQTAEETRQSSIALKVKTRGKRFIGVKKKRETNKAKLSFICLECILFKLLKKMRKKEQREIKEEALISSAEEGKANGEPRKTVRVGGLIDFSEAYFEKKYMTQTEVCATLEGRTLISM